MPDPILKMLVGLVDLWEKSDKDRGGVELTISVGGLLISGNLISRKTYMSLLLDGGIQDVLDEAGIQETANDDGFEFLHLASVKFWNPGLNPAHLGGDGAVWRGRIDRIDGYFYGSIGLVPGDI